MTAGKWASLWEPAEIAEAGMPHPHKVLDQKCTAQDKETLTKTFKKMFDFLTGD